MGPLNCLFRHYLHRGALMEQELLPDEKSFVGSRFTILQPVLAQATKPSYPSPANHVPLISRLEKAIEPKKKSGTSFSFAIGPWL